MLNRLIVKFSGELYVIIDDELEVGGVLGELGHIKNKVVC
jgi:hypothetical protein